jgi:hypothetical protein
MSLKRRRPGLGLTAFFNETIKERLAGSSNVKVPPSKDDHAIQVADPALLSIVLLPFALYER